MELLTWRIIGDLVSLVSRLIKGLTGVIILVAVIVIILTKSPLTSQVRFRIQGAEILGLVV